MKALSDWLPELLVAIAVTAVATPLARRVALKIGVLDHPAERKSHGRPIPYLGGLAIVAGVLSGLFVGTPNWHLEVIGLSGLSLMGIGLVDDIRGTSISVRVAIEVACAAVAVGMGLRLPVAGRTWGGAIAALLVLVAASNSMNLMDNMDGLAAGSAVSGGATVLVLAALNHDASLAAGAAGLIGASGAFLVFNKRPASIFMGDAGSLFLGYWVAALTLRYATTYSTGSDLMVPGLVLALPFLDTLTVTVERIRHGRSALEGGRDHLSHRLSMRGLGPGWSVLALVSTQLGLGALAVAVERGWLDMRLAIAIAVLPLALVLVEALTVDPYSETVVRRQRLIQFQLPAPKHYLCESGLPDGSIDSQTALDSGKPPGRHL